MSDDLLKRASEARRLIRSARSRGAGHQPRRTALCLACRDRPATSMPARCCCCPISHSTRRTSRPSPVCRCCSRRPPGYADPLAGPRLTLLGRAERVDDPRAARPASRRGTRRAPSTPVLPISTSIASRSSAAISSPGSAASPGSRASNLRFAADASAARRRRAGDRRAYERRPCRCRAALCTNVCSGAPATGWRMTGIDPEGLDLRRQSETDGETARLDFPEPVLTPAAARRVLVALAEAGAAPVGPDLAARLLAVSPQPGCLPRQCAGLILSAILASVRRAWRMPGVNGGKLGSGGQTLACACSPLRPRRARDAPSSTRCIGT